MPPDVPTGCETGTEWAAEVEKLPDWIVMSSYGGFIFGRWPSVVVAFYTNGVESLYGMAVYDHGKVTVTWYPNYFRRWEASFGYLVAPYRAEPRHS
jgi:hypothetical protein